MRTTKFYFKLLCIIVIIGISIYSCLFGFKNILKNENFFNSKSSQCIITIWHIETFEGGKKARVEYLKNIAKSLEKNNNEVLFYIKSIQPENLQSELEVSTPDIISFGYGVGKIILPSLKNFSSTFSVREKLQNSGMFNDKLYAIPYMVGGYVICNHSRSNSEFHVGTNEFIHPERIYEKLNLKPTEIEGQYDAYKDFVYNKNVKLLGTTRDLFRVLNLNSLGRTSAEISPIDSYTDLIQYLGVISINDHTLKFIDSCLSFDNQSKLVEYALFSSLSHKLYYNGIYSDMEDAIYRAQIPNVFYD